MAIAVFAGLVLWQIKPNKQDGKGDADSLQGVAGEQAISKPEAEPLANQQGQEASPGAEILDEPQSHEIERLSDGYLVLENQVGDRVQGLSILVEEDDSLLGWMAIPGRVGSALYHQSILQEGESFPGSTGLAVTEEGNRADLHFVIAEGYEPIVEAWKPLAAGETHKTKLTPVDPISVTVQDEDGNPIPGAEIWVRWIGELTLNEEGSTVERLQGRHYQEAIIADEEGKATVTVCFPGKANSLFVRPGDAFASQQVVCSSGEDVVITCESAFTIKGKITVDGKLPETEVRLTAMLPIGESFSFLESARAKEEGKYLMGGVLAGYPTLLVQAMGEGLAMQMRHIPGGMPGEIVEIDFDMKPGIGGEIVVHDAWGDPLPGATIQLVGEGDQRHVYLYEANEQGKVTLPVAFPTKSSYWMELGFSGMTMRVPEPFDGGDHLVIHAENQARISSVSFDPALLDGAMITELTWRSSEPRVGGAASWENSEEASPILVAGRGSLSAVLSDGRKFTVGSYLEPGAQGPIAFKVQPSALRFEVPEGLVVSVYLLDQLGSYTFGGEGLAGTIEVPCSVGDYSLGVYWENDSYILPGVHVPSEGLDLGLLKVGDSGEVWGTVSSAEGNPLGWCDLVISSQDGYYFYDGVTDLDGTYSMTGLPVGEYYLYASSFQYHGGKGLSRIQQFAVTAANPVVQLDLVMGEAQGKVFVHHSSSTSGGMEIILATESGVQFREASPTGMTHLPSQSLPGWVGAVSARGSTVSVASIPVQAGPGTVKLQDFSSSFREIKVVDEHGSPRFDMILRIELAGFPPTGRMAPDGDGILKFSVVGEGPWSLYARDGLGMSHSISLREALAAGRFVVPRDQPKRILKIVDTSGSALSHARAMDEGMQDVFRADTEGLIEVPLKHDWVVADAYGYLPVWVGPDQKGNVALPRAFRNVKVVLPDGVASLSLHHAYADNAAVAIEVQVGESQREVILPPVPEGEVQITLLGSELNEIASESFHVSDAVTSLEMGTQ